MSEVRYEPISSAVKVWTADNTAPASAPNAQPLGLLTGMLYVTAGVPRVAVSGTDYVSPAAIAIPNHQVAYGNSGGTGITSDINFTWDSSKVNSTVGPALWLGDRTGDPTGYWTHQIQAKTAPNLSLGVYNTRTDGQSFIEVASDSLGYLSIFSMGSTFGGHIQGFTASNMSGLLGGGGGVNSPFLIATQAATPIVVAANANLNTSTSTTTAYNVFFDTHGNSVFSPAGLAPTASDGFFYFPMTTGGPPTTAPRAYAGHAVPSVDPTAHTFWFYDGAWNQVANQASINQTQDQIVYGGATNIGLASSSTFKYTRSAGANSVFLQANSTSGTDIAVQNTNSAGTAYFTVQNDNGNSTGSFIANGSAITGGGTTLGISNQNLMTLYGAGSAFLLASGPLSGVSKPLIGAVANTTSTAFIEGWRLTMGTTDATRVNTTFGGGALTSGGGTDGFPYIPTSAGALTSTITTFTGRAAIAIDSINHTFNFNDAGPTWYRLANYSDLPNQTQDQIVVGGTSGVGLASFSSFKYTRGTDDLVFLNSGASNSSTVAVRNTSTTGYATMFAQNNSTSYVQVYANGTAYNVGTFLTLALNSLTRLDAGTPSGLVVGTMTSAPMILHANQRAGLSFIPGATDTTKTNVAVGPATALATSATDGLFYLPTMAGAPAATPSHAGLLANLSPVVVDSTNHTLNFWDSAGWHTFTTSALTSAYYQTMQSGGVAQTQRNNLNFTSVFNLTDDGVNNRTNVGLASVIGAATYGGAGVSSVTVNAAGQVTGVGTATYLTSAFYQTVQVGGTGVAQEAALNFSAASFTAVDDSVNHHTNIALATQIAAGTYGGSGVASITVNAAGQVTGVTSVTALTSAFYQVVKNSGGASSTQRSSTKYSSAFAIGDNGTDTTIDLAAVVTGGVYGGGGVASLTFNNFGQVTSLTVPAVAYVQGNNTVSAGLGLTGGGTLASNPVISMPAIWGGGTTVLGGTGLASISVDQVGRVVNYVAASYLTGSFTAGSALFSAGGTTVAQDNANYFYDSTNHRLGVALAGTAPSKPIDVNGGSGDAIRLRRTNLQEGGIEFFDALYGTSARITSVFGTSATPNDLKFYVGGLVGQMRSGVGLAINTGVAPAYALDLASLATTGDVMRLLQPSTSTGVFGLGIVGGLTCAAMRINDGSGGTSGALKFYGGSGTNLNALTIPFLTITPPGSVIMTTTDAATNATDVGFYARAMNGVPTGVWSPAGNMVPLVYDYTDRVYFQGAPSASTSAFWQIGSVEKISNPTTTYSVLDTDSVILAYPGTGAFNVFLPSTSGRRGKRYYVKNEFPSNFVGVIAAASDTISCAPGPGFNTVTLSAGTGLYGIELLCASEHAGDSPGAWQVISTCMVS